MTTQFEYERQERLISALEDVGDALRRMVQLLERIEAKDDYGRHCLRIWIANPEPEEEPN